MAASGKLLSCPPSRSEFRIAIVCALRDESTAVLAMFQELWDTSTVDRVPNDPNEYSIGRIGVHNVVLAYLPGMGTNSAAASISSLRTAYDNIELSLLVGICGGVPYKGDEEIILGDVVVSDSIVQYDYGSKDPHTLKRKDAVGDNLPRPVPRIRSFLHSLQTVQGKADLQRDMRLNLARMLDQSDFFSWRRPPQSTDRLFGSHYRHKHQHLGICDICDACKEDRDETCEESLKAACIDLGCSDEHSVLRKRVETAILHNTHLHPTVNFGTVASANQVMKSAIDRDSISRRENAIAFEMEGAGLWDYAPTIIVKGVCDYADSHKSKEWQKYACAAAASCMKAVLKKWTSARSAKRLHTLRVTSDTGKSQNQTKKVIDALWFREIADRFDGVEKAQFESFKWIFHREKNPLLKRTSGNEARYAWKIDYRVPSPLLNYTKDFQLGKTSEWDPCELKSWLRDGEGIFWITGKPGCGKSTLMKLLYEDTQYIQLLREWATGYTLLAPSFFFWRAGSEMQKSHLGLLQSLLHEILKSHPALLDRVLEPTEQEEMLHMNERNSNDLRPYWTLEGAQRLFKKLLGLKEIKICILIDGLDEMMINHSHIADYLTELTQNHKVKIIVSGRFLSEFSGSFHGCRTVHLHDWTVHDAEVYVRGRLLGKKFLREQAEDSPEFFEGFIRDILRKAEGVFIWIKTAVTALIEGMYKSDTLSELQNRLDELPGELYELYETILHSLDKRYESQSKSFLSLLITAKEQQGVPYGIFFSVASRYDQTNPDWILEECSRSRESFEKLQAWTKRRIESRCSQFVTCRDTGHNSEWKVDFMHRTVVDFLESPKMRLWLSVGSPGTDFYPVAISMAYFCYRWIGVDVPTRQSFMTRMLMCRLDWTKDDVPITDFAALAIRQLEVAAFKWFGDDSSFPFNTSERIIRALESRNSICEHLVHFYLMKVWGQHSKNRRNVAFICLMFHGHLAGTALKYLESDPFRLTTEDRVHILTASAFSENVTQSRILKYLYSQDPSCATLYWERIMLISSCQANVLSGGYRFNQESFFGDSFETAVKELLRLGVDPNALVQCSPAALQYTILQSPLRVFRRCEASAKTTSGVYYVHEDERAIEERNHVAEVSSIIETLLGYGALDLETQQPEPIQQLEEAELMEHLAECIELQKTIEFDDLQGYFIGDCWAQERGEEGISEIYAREQAEENEKREILESLKEEDEGRSFFKQYEEDENVLLEHDAEKYDGATRRKRKRGEGHSNNMQEE